MVHLPGPLLAPGRDLRLRPATRGYNQNWHNPLQMRSYRTRGRPSGVSSGRYIYTEVFFPTSHCTEVCVSGRNPMRQVVRQENLDEPHLLAVTAVTLSAKWTVIQSLVACLRNGLALTATPTDVNVEPEVGPLPAARSM